MRTTFRIVVGVDGSRQSQQALDWAVAEAASRDRAGQPAVVQAVMAWQADPLPSTADTPVGSTVADATLTAAVSAARTRYPGVAVAGVAVEGSPAEVIGRAADDADLLVLGAHGHGPQYHTGLGTVTEACVRNAVCPVVVIPVSRSSSTSFVHETLATTMG